MSLVADDTDNVTAIEDSEMTHRVSAFATLLWLVTIAKGHACVVLEELPTPEELVRRSDAIVRVMALNYRESSSQQDTYGRPITFRVVETLKGNVGASTLSVRGTLVESHNGNNHPFPYRFGRNPDIGGPCFALSYRKGASYLLLLKQQDSGLSPYWQPLGPVNEQLSSDDDPWLLWVKNALRSGNKPEFAQTTADQRWFDALSTAPDRIESQQVESDKVLLSRNHWLLMI